MDDHELEALFLSPESDRVERKEAVSDKDRISEAICAFANDLPDHRKPGVIFIGVTDGGRCAGLAITDALLLALAELRDSGNIQPIPSITVQQRVFDGCAVAVIVVMPSDAPPVRFRGRTYIRVGPRRAIATPEEERRLVEKRRRANLPFDLTPIPEASLADLDLGFFRSNYLPSAVAPDVLAMNARTESQQLAALRMTTQDGIPTVAGLLALGLDPSQFLSCAYIQFIRFLGADMASDIQTEKALSGPLHQLMRLADDVLAASISVSLDIKSGLTEVRSSDYPLTALRQLLSNALMHRSYEGTNSPIKVHWFSDRIEIINPGGPFGVVTRQNFGSPGVADYRNPHIAEAMKVLGFVQRFGVGLQIARSELEKNGNPRLEWDVGDTYVLITVRPAR
jgi:ATP-dependent DNA helicase RecG